MERLHEESFTLLQHMCRDRFAITKNIVDNRIKKVSEIFELDRQILINGVGKHRNFLFSLLLEKTTGRYFLHRVQEPVDVDGTVGLGVFHELVA